MEKWLSVKIPLKQLTATVFRQGLQEMLLRLVGFQIEKVVEKGRFPRHLPVNEGASLRIIIKFC